MRYVYLSLALCIGLGLTWYAEHPRRKPYEVGIHNQTGADITNASAERPTGSSTARFRTQPKSIGRQPMGRPIALAYPLQGLHRQTSTEHSSSLWMLTVLSPSKQFRWANNRSLPKIVFEITNVVGAGSGSYT
jgi:hypothetical protein